MVIWKSILSGRSHFETSSSFVREFKMAVACNSKEGLPLGFSLHLRAEEAIAKFQKEIEDDFNYLHEILAEAKQHFGRWECLNWVFEWSWTLTQR